MQLHLDLLVDDRRQAVFARDLRDDLPDINLARGECRREANEALENLSAESTADDSRERVAEGSEAQVLKQRSRKVAADCTAHELNNKGNDIHLVLQIQARPRVDQARRIAGRLIDSENLPP